VFIAVVLVAVVVPLAVAVVVVMVVVAVAAEYLSFFFKVLHARGTISLSGYVDD